MTPGRGPMPPGRISRKEMTGEIGRTNDRHDDLFSMTIILLAK